MTYLDLLPNPFLPHLNPAVGSAAPVDANPTPSPTTAAGAAFVLYSEETAGYPCCYNCGYREPCDEHCPRAESRFQIDEAAFLAEVEPVPEFISRKAG